MFEWSKFYKIKVARGFLKTYITTWNGWYKKDINDYVVNSFKMEPLLLLLTKMSLVCK